MQAMERAQKMALKGLPRSQKCYKIEKKYIKLNRINKEGPFFG